MTDALLEVGDLRVTFPVGGREVRAVDGISFTVSPGATLAIIAVGCVPIGGAIPGFVAATLVPAYGWPILFWIGGIVPLVIGIAAIFGLPESIKYMALHERERSRMEALIAELDQSVFFQREGTLVLWHRQDATEAARLERVLARTGEVVPELPAMRTLDGAGIDAIEPALGRRFTRALLLPGEGQLDNRALLAALLAALQASPRVRLHWH